MNPAIKNDSFDGYVSECWNHWSVTTLASKSYLEGIVTGPAWIELKGSAEYFAARYVDDLDLGKQSIARYKQWSDARVQQTD